MTARGLARWRRSLATAAALVAVGMSITFSSLAAPAQTVESTGSLAVRQVTGSAAGGPFLFELTDGAPVPLVQQGVATTSAEGEPVDVAGLGGDLTPGAYTLRQDIAQLPSAPTGGNWEFTSAECDGAAVAVDALTATATITLEPGAAATCVITDTWVADADTPPPEPAPSGDDDGVVSQQVEAPLAPDDVVVPLAIPPLSCSGGTIYQVQRTNGSNGILNAVAVGSMSGTDPVTATQVSATIPNNPPNALGISAGGLGAWVLAPQTPTGTGDTLIFQLYSFDTATELWTNHTATVDTTDRLPAGVTAASIRDSGGIVAGAIDPLSGNYYWASLANAPNNSLTIFGWNTATDTLIGVVANSTWPEDVPPSGATNGDIAFDRNGNLYIVSSVGTNAATGVIEGPLPTTQQTPTPTLTDTTLATYDNPNSRAFNGIAFDNTGSLFIQSSAGTTTQILKADPTAGEILAGPSSVNFPTSDGTIGVDLAACSAPPALQLQKNVINRQAPGDQFNLSITGGGITSGNTATTSGSANGVQAETAGPVLGVTGTTYTFTETGAGTTTLSDYTTTYQCVDQGANNAVVASGTGQSFTFTLPPPGPIQAGQFILCTFTNSAPSLVVTKSSTATLITPGAEVPYTVTVSNTGPVAATSVVVTDVLPVGLTFVSSVPACTAAAQTVTCALGELAGGASATIEIVTLAAEPFPPDAVDPSGFVVNTARVTSPGTNCSEGSTDPACDDDHALPVFTTVAITKTSVSTSFAPGGEVPYVITVANTGSVVARNVVVTDDLPVGLTFISSAPACTAAGQLVTCSIGDLAFGATATIDFVTRAADPFPTETLVNGEVVNVAIVSGTDTNCDAGSSDPVCTDNWAIPSTEVAGAADTREDEAAGGSLPFTGAAILGLLMTAVAAIAAGVLLLFMPRIPAAGRRARFARMMNALRSRLDPTS